MLFGKKRKLQKLSNKIASDFLRAYREISEEYPGDSKKKICRKVVEREFGLPPNLANSLINNADGMPGGIIPRNVTVIVVATIWNDFRSLDGDVYVTEIFRIIPEDL